VPIYTGGYSKAAMRRAARSCEGFLSAGNKPDEVPGVIAELNAMRREAGRDQLPFEIIFPLTTPYSLDDFKRAEEAGAHGIMAHPPKFTIGTHSTIDQKKAEMERFAENFIRHMA
jgi:alkanesulfonate monooxygenase SsuD/methylene tetrahydromethanopterin reductase-like flavin-dependent oxidoreductase (luciferase family)